MSQANFTPISLYYSTTASAVPTAANLVPGELAINTNDGKLYYEDSSGVVQVLATKSTGSIGGSNTQVQFNNSGSLGGSSGLTWDGSFLTTSSIKNSALTSGRVTYAGASGLLSDSASLTYNGTTLTASTGANFVTTSGSVGVGTASPQALLHVGAVAEAPGFGTTTQMCYVNGTSQPELLIRQTANDVVVSMYADSTSGSIRTATNHPLVFFTNNTDRMRLDTSGNLGLGVTPSAWNSSDKAFQYGSNSAIWNQGSSYNIVGQNWYHSATGDFRITTGYATRYFQGLGNHFWDIAGTANAGTSISATTAMTLDASGNLLVNTTTAKAQITTDFNGSATNGIGLNDTASANGTVFASFWVSSTSIGTIQRVTTTNAVVYNTTSDYRLKTVTGSVTGQGERIDALKPIDYQWKEGNQQARGFLAHEFQTVYPNSVSGEKDAIDSDGKPVYQAMQAATSEVIADLVAEIQSLRQRIKTLENK